jgi:fructose-1,6-bisphosphatase
MFTFLIIKKANNGFISGVHKEYTNFDSELRNVKLKIITEDLNSLCKSNMLDKIFTQLDMVRSEFF